MVTPEMLLLIQSEVLIVLTGPFQPAFQPAALTLNSKATWAWASGGWAELGRPLVSWSRPVRLCGLGVLLCHGRTKSRPFPRERLHAVEARDSLRPRGRWSLTWGPLQWLPSRSPAQPLQDHSLDLSEAMLLLMKWNHTAYFLMDSVV